MNYDFDTFVPRRGTECEKWDSPAEDDVLPLWVADMDFRAAPAIVNALRRRVDEVVKVTDDEAFSASRELARREGIVAGSSSGGALAAALKAIRAGLRGNVVTLFPDRGDRYISKGLFPA